MRSDSIRLGIRFAFIFPVVLSRNFSCNNFVIFFHLSKRKDDDEHNNGDQQKNQNHENLWWRMSTAIYYMAYLHKLIYFFTQKMHAHMCLRPEACWPHGVAKKMLSHWPTVAMVTSASRMKNRKWNNRNQNDFKYNTWRHTSTERIHIRIRYQQRRADGIPMRTLSCHQLRAHEQYVVFIWLFFSTIM